MEDADVAKEIQQKILAAGGYLDDIPATGEPEPSAEF